jgi:pyruvate/2-oxoglutarate dehydrogenase complex dihydrolipoamide dehydrogenase (E3) component
LALSNLPREENFSGAEPLQPAPSEARQSPLKAKSHLWLPKAKIEVQYFRTVSMGDNYQLAIIGSGSGGREATRLAARSGLRTALVEKDHIGGTCFHSGCYAVLALQASAREFRDRWRSGRFGNKVDLLKETLRDWMITQSNVSSRLVDDFRTELEQLGVDLYQGHGQFIDERAFQIVDASGTIRTISADNAIVATGSRPAFSSRSGPRLMNSDELLRIRSLPEQLAIVGAGYIGCEFAAIYRTLGCEVTVI